MPQDIGSRAYRVTSNPGRRRHANRLSGPDISAKYSACTLSAFAGGHGRIADLTWPKSKRISCHMNCSSPIFPFQRITTSPNTEPSRPGRRPRVSSPALHIQSSACLPTPRLQDRPRRALVPPPSVPPPSSAPAQTSADADPHPSHGSQVSSCPRSCLSWPLLYTAATAGF